MLDANGFLRSQRRDAPTRAKAAPSFTEILAVLKHHRVLVGSVVAAFLAVAVIYVATAPRLFTATASLLIETRREDPMQKERPAADAQGETAAIESQAQLLTSDAIAQVVVRGLDLVHDPEFTQDDSFLPVRIVRGLIDRVLNGPSTAKGPPTAQDVEDDVVARLVHAISATRSGRSYVITLSAISRDPEKAARIANAVASAYSEDQLNFRLATVDRSTVWLKARAAELRQQALDADRAVQEYKTANNIVDTPRGFVSEQQLNDMNSQLVLARTAVAEKKARLDRARRLGEDGMPDASFAESLANPVIVKLRQQYLDDSRREGELRARYGESHPAVIALRANLDELRRSVRDEMGRIAESFESDYRNAKASEEELERNLAGVIEQTGKINGGRVQLRALETTAQTYRTLFETFLQQYATTLQQQSFPLTTARVISPAKAPKRKSHPRTSLILLGSLVGGLGIGWLGAFARESLHPTLREAREVEDATGLTLIGQLTEITQARRLGWGRRAAPRPAENCLVGRTDPLLQITRLYPGSRFSATIRHIQAALDHAGRRSGSGAAQAAQAARVVGVLSAEPGDGKTVVAANLAQLLAKSGRRTVLVDCDIHGAALTHTTGLPAPDQVPGADLGAAIVVDAESGLRFLSNAGMRRDRHGSDALCPPALTALIEQLRDRFEVVVLDLPCLDSVMEARAVAEVADGVVVVCAADHTHSDALVRALDRWDAAGTMPLVGFVLNRVRVRERRSARTAGQDWPNLARAIARRGGRGEDGGGRPGLRAVT